MSYLWIFWVLWRRIGLIVSSLVLITHHAWHECQWQPDSLTSRSSPAWSGDQRSLPARVIETYARRKNPFCALINFCALYTVCLSMITRYKIVLFYCKLVLRLALNLHYKLHVLDLFNLSYWKRSVWIDCFVNANQYRLEYWRWIF